MPKLFALSLLLLSAPLLAQSLPERLAALDAMSARVVQKTYDFDGSLLQESQANLALKKPGQLYWETGEPDEMAVVCDGETLWVHQKLLEQVTLYDASQLIEQSPFALLLGDSNSWQNYRISQKGDSYTLIPAIDSEYAELRLTFKGDELAQLQVIDTQGQKLLFDFTAVSRGADAVKTIRFELLPPAGVTVDDQRAKRAP